MKAPCFSPLIRSDSKPPKIRGGVGKRKAAACNLMEQGWKANKKTSRSLTCEFERLTSASPLIKKISNRAPARRKATLPRGAPSESPSDMRSAFQKGHIAASMDMHIDLDGRKPTPIPRHRPQILLSPLTGEFPYQHSARKAVAMERSMEMDSLALDLGSLQFEQQQQHQAGSCGARYYSEAGHNATQVFTGYFDGSSCSGKEMQQWGACVSVQQQQQLQPPMALPPLTKCLSYG